MTFPINPSPGDSYDAYGTVWVYAGTVNGWYRQIVSTQNDTTYTSAISGPAGSNTQVQFNDNGELAGDSGLTYNKTTDALSGGAFIPTGSTVPTNGLYRPSANNVAISTNGTERLRITSAGNVGISTAAPQSLASIGVGSSTENGLSLTFVGDNSIKAKFYASTSSGAVTIGGSASGYFPVFISNNSEAARIDTSGRLLVGTSSARTVGEIVGGTTYTHQPQFQLESPNNSLGLSLITNRSADSTGPFITLGKSRGNALGGVTVVQNGDELGNIYFAGADGTDIECIGAAIFAEVDGTPGANDMPGRLVFSTTADGASSPTERMRIGSNGTVTITQSNSGTYGEYISFANGGYGLGISNASGGVADFVYFFSPNYVGSINTSGSTTSYLSASDYRLKENIALVADSITRLQKLKPVRFNFIADPTKTVDGFIAHEVQSVVPEAITGEKDAVDDEGNPVYQGIDQSKLVPLLTAALQEAIAKIESLEARLTAAGI